MEHFWIVTLFHLQPDQGQLEQIEALALNQHQAMGIEEYSMTEAEVDALLGERSYSGGDLPEAVIDEVDLHHAGRPSNYRFFFETGASASEFESEVKRLFLCESQIEQAKSQDWNAEWKKHYAPITVSGELEIVPAWRDDHVSSSKHKLFINPGMGFGTGSHETTFLCLSLFTKHVLDESIATVLDFGSGSGILGLASLLFFPDAQVDFYDIDPEANKNCYHNAQINKLEEKAFRLLLPEVREKLHSQYDLVFANILESILLLEKDALLKMTRKHLILSGLLRHQVPTIVEAYSSLKLVEQVDKGDWSALIFSRE
jgi:ribosomal protein L11 methyltransferase